MISCLVVVVDRDAPLRECLDSIVQQGLPEIRVIVIDDTCSPALAEMLRTYGPTVLYLANSEPVGLAACWNRGLEASHSHYVAFLNATNRYVGGALQQLLGPFQANPAIEACIGQVVHFGEGLPDRLRQPRRAHLTNAMLCRRSALARVGQFTASLQFQAEAQWFVQAELCDVNIHFVAHSVLERRVPDSPAEDWCARYQEMDVVAAQRKYHQSLFEFPPGLLRLRVENLALFENWCRAWQPYRVEEGTPDLSVDVFDEVFPPFGSDFETALLPPRQQAQGQLTSWDDVYFVNQRPALSLIYRSDQARALVRLRAAFDLAVTDLSKPLEAVLLGWLAEKGWLVFHATVIAWQGQGVLLVGPENSGKSSVAANCLEAGWEFVADDLVVLNQEQESTCAHGIYACIWLDPENAVHFSGLAGHLQTSPLDPKGVLVLANFLSADRLLRRAPIVAVVCPQFGGECPRITPGQRSQALRVLVASTFLKVAGGPSQAKLDMACQALRDLECWSLLLGPRGSSVAPLMRQVLPC